MSILKSLANSINIENVFVKKKSRQLQTNPESKPFNMKFPIVTENYYDEVLIDNLAKACNVDLIPYDCWGAIYKKGEYTKPHEHWPQIWSWVYNVECCEKCSPLIFPDHDIKEYSLIPKKGNLTLFPGWIKHYVPEQKCDHDRIIIAGNLGVNPWKLISGIEKRYDDNLETFINTYK